VLDIDYDDGKEDKIDVADAAFGHSAEIGATYGLPRPRLSPPTASAAILKGPSLESVSQAHRCDEFAPKYLLKERGAGIVEVRVGDGRSGKKLSYFNSRSMTKKNR
jgi:hypothetical protein